MGNFFKFLRFLSIFLCLELCLICFSLLLEFYRIILYKFSIDDNRSNIHKRRVLKEITSMNKGNANELFDYKFFIIVFYLFLKFIGF
jgi:hypothetical protein